MTAHVKGRQITALLSYGRFAIIPSMQWRFGSPWIAPDLSSHWEGFAGSVIPAEIKTADFGGLR
jgi:hypothetical protein